MHGMCPCCQAACRRATGAPPLIRKETAVPVPLLPEHGQTTTIIFYALSVVATIPALILAFCMLPPLPRQHPHPVLPCTVSSPSTSPPPPSGGVHGACLPPVRGLAPRAHPGGRDVQGHGARPRGRAAGGRARGAGCLGLPRYRVHALPPPAATAAVAVARGEEGHVCEERGGGAESEEGAHVDVGGRGVG